MRRPLVTCLLTLSLVVFALPARIASASAAARAPHAAVQARKGAGKKAKPARTQKVKASKPKPDKKKNDRGFEL